MNTAIAVINIGEKYQKVWKNIFSPTVFAYADRNSYEVHEFTEPIDSGTTKPPHWQKLLLAGAPQLQKYDRIVYLDSDVLCNPTAPGIAETVPDGKIGAVTWQGSYFADPVDYDLFRKSWTENAVAWIRDAQIESFSDLSELGGYPRNEDWLNSGVLVFQPSHSEFFQNIYDNEPHTQHSAAEQQALTHWLCNARKDLLHPLDRRFNAIFYLYRARWYPFLDDLVMNESFIVPRCVEAMLMDNYMIHFCASPEQHEAKAFMRQCHLLEAQLSK